MRANFSLSRVRSRCMCDDDDLSRTQIRHCYARYNEFHRCAAEKDPESNECKFYQKAYRSLCPAEWVEQWNEERENGTFPGRF